MIYKFEKFSLDTSRRELRFEANLVAVEPQVFDLLHYLICNRDRVVDKDDLIAGVWHGRIVSESTLSSRITAVRQSINDTGKQQRLIRTIPRKGIRFVGEVEEQNQNLGSEPANKETLTVSPSPGQQYERLSLAVLAFDCMSPREADVELCRGLQEDLMTGLSRLRWLSVMARDSSPQPDERRNLAKLTASLGVHFLLEGSVQRRASRLRVTAQLIDARGNHLWAEHYDGSANDHFALQDELTQKIVAAIEQTLVSTTVHSFGRADNLDEIPLRRANRLHRSLEREHSEQAQKLLRDLVASPNASVAAYQLLANTLEVTIDCFWAEDPTAAAADALALSQRAVQLAPLDYLSHYVLGRALLHLRHYDLAIAAARRSVELNPNSGTSLGGLGGVLAFSGNAEEATAISERGFKLSPPEPYTALWSWYAAIATIRLQQFENALRHAEGGILVKPDVATGYLLRAIAYCGLSRLTDAQASIQQARTRSESLTLARIPKFMPYRHASDLENIIEALRNAGMPN